MDLCIVYLWPRIKDAMTAAKGPIGFQTIWGLALVANIIRQWHPGQLFRGVGSGLGRWKKTREFLPSQNRHPYLSYKSSRKIMKNTMKSSGIAVVREKKDRQLAVFQKKGEGWFPKWRRYSRYSNKNKIKQVRFSSMVSASLSHKTCLSVRAEESLTLQ